MKKRLLSMLMAVLMIASLVPATALAADTTADDEYIINQKADADKKQPGITVKANGDSYDVVITPFAKIKNQCEVCTKLVKEELIKATCEDAGLTVYYCGVCGKEMMKPLVTEKTAHTYTFTVVEKPTCTESGWGYAQCTGCKVAVAVLNSAAAVKLLPADATEATIKATKALFDAAGHADAVLATEDIYAEDAETVIVKAKVEAAHAITIGGVAVAYDEDGNIVDASVKGAKVADVAGYSGDKYCPTCEAVVTAGAAVASLDVSHKANMKVVTAGEKPYLDVDGEKTNGKTDVVYCAICDKTYGGKELTYDEYFAVPEEEADPVIGATKTVNAKAATCCEEGYTGDEMKYVQSGVDKDGKITGAWVLNKKGETIKKLDHHFVKYVNKAATCTEAGMVAEGWYVCDKVVGEDADGEDIYCTATSHDLKYKAPYEVPATGHKFVEKVLVAATDKHTGLSVLKCACGEYEMDGENVKIYSTHSGDCVAAEELVNVVEATCTEKGYSGDVVCAICGEVITKGEETEMVEHNYVNGVCSVCGAADPDYVENPFTDVSKDSKFYSAIIWAVQNKVTNGTSATTFSPNKGCSRAEIVAFLYNAAGCPEVGADVVNPFTDVSKDSNFYNAIMWAVEKGITKGTTDTTFSPSKVCTRGEIVTFLFRASGAEKVSTGVAFNDVAEGSYCYDAVAWAVANEVAYGKTSTTFAPADTCTRAEAVTFIYRASAE